MSKIIMVKKIGNCDVILDDYILVDIGLGKNDVVMYEIGLKDAYKNNAFDDDDNENDSEIRIEKIAKCSVVGRGNDYVSNNMLFLGIASPDIWDIKNNKLCLVRTHINIIGTFKFEDFEKEDIGVGCCQLRCSVIANKAYVGKYILTQSVSKIEGKFIAADGYEKRDISDYDICNFSFVKKGRVGEMTGASMFLAR